MVNRNGICVTTVMLCIYSIHIKYATCEVYGNDEPTFDVRGKHTTKQKHTHTTYTEKKIAHTTNTHNNTQNTHTQQNTTYNKKKTKQNKNKSHTHHTYI